MTRYARIADRTISPSTGKRITASDNADVARIIALIMQADRLSQPFTKRFAHYLRGKNDLDTLRKVWSFVKDNIEYRRDEPGNEVVKSPGALWESKVGDCKSFSVMIGSLLSNLGYAYKYRVAFYNPVTPEQGHIYPVVILGNGTEVIVDAVHSRFNAEAKYWKAYDYEPATGTRKKASRLAGLGLPVEQGMSLYIGGILATIAAILWWK